MIAIWLGTILPLLTAREAIEATKIYSVAGQLGGRHLVQARALRAPHHTCSSVGLAGQGDPPAPWRGEPGAQRGAVPRRAARVAAGLAGFSCSPGNWWTLTKKAPSS